MNRFLLFSLASTLAITAQAQTCPINTLYYNGSGMMLSKIDVPGSTMTPTGAVPAINDFNPEATSYDAINNRMIAGAYTSTGDVLVVINTSNAAATTFPLTFEPTIAEYSPSNGLVYSTRWTPDSLELVSINSNTGAVSSVDILPLDDFNPASSTFDPVNNLIYVTAYTFGGNTVIAKINALTGQVDTSIVPSFDTYILEYSPLTGLLYSINGSMNLVSINPSTGIETVIGLIPGLTDYYGETDSYNATNNQLVVLGIDASNNDKVYLINLTNAQVDNTYTPPANFYGMLEAESCATVGLNEKETSAISFFPNPAANKININNIAGKTDLSIIDLKGCVVLNTSLISNSNEIDLSDLTAGLYFVKLISAEGKLSIQKLVIEK